MLDNRSLIMEVRIQSDVKKDIVHNIARAIGC